MRESGLAELGHSLIPPTLLSVHVDLGFGPCFLPDHASSTLDSPRGSRVCLCNGLDSLDSASNEPLAALNQERGLPVHGFSRSNSEEAWAETKRNLSG